MKHAEDRAIIQTGNGQEIHIRLLSTVYIQPLQAFNENLSEHTRSQFLPHSYEEEIIRKYIERNSNGTDRIYVALSEAAVIGYLFLWDFKKPFPVLGIGIADAFQGQGLGKKMMDILIEDAKTNGNDGILLTTVLNNEAAYQLYLKKGFVYLGDTDNIAGDGRVVRERMMYLPLAEGVVPEVHDFEPPVL